jgi:hypothetical protein
MNTFSAPTTPVFNNNNPPPPVLANSVIYAETCAVCRDPPTNATVCNTGCVVCSDCAASVRSRRLCANCGGDRGSQEGKPVVYTTFVCGTLSIPACKPTQLWAHRSGCDRCKKNDFRGIREGVEQIRQENMNASRDSQKLRADHNATTKNVAVLLGALQRVMDMYNNLANIHIGVEREKDLLQRKQEYKCAVLEKLCTTPGSLAMVAEAMEFVPPPSMEPRMSTFELLTANERREMNEVLKICNSIRIAK